MWLYETREMTHDQLTVCYCQISITIVSHISQDQVQYINQVLQVKIAYHNHNHNFITLEESITFGLLISTSFLTQCLAR